MKRRDLSIEISENLINSINRYIEEEYIPEPEQIMMVMPDYSVMEQPSIMAGKEPFENCSMEPPVLAQKEPKKKQSFALGKKKNLFSQLISGAKEGEDDLKTILDGMDDTFGHFVTEIIDKKGLKDSDVYNRANLSRQVWNNIKNGKVKNPSKPTVCALILALELPLDESEVLLRRAGYAFSRSSKFDLIIKYCVEHKLYDIMTVNEILYGNDQQLLGTK